MQAAAATDHDLLARLAVVPLVLEARGLDVTPVMIQRLARAGDDASAAVLETIYQDEIGHVATGWRWFRRACAARAREPADAFREALARHHGGLPKPPFNHAARALAGLDRQLYDAG